MNPALAKYARDQIASGLAELPEDWHKTFKLMYGRGEMYRGGKMQYTVEEALARPLEEIVAQIPDEKLDWAMQQIENSINKFNNRP